MTKTKVLVMLLPWEGAEKGYNPHKKGRPSHTYHTYMIANLKLVLEVEVQPGNQANSKYSLPGLMSLLERFPKMCWPAFVRGDCDWGTDRVMTELEQAGCHYLFGSLCVSRSCLF